MSETAPDDPMRALFARATADIHDAGTAHDLAAAAGWMSAAVVVLTAVGSVVVAAVLVGSIYLGMGLIVALATLLQHH